MWKQMTDPWKPGDVISWRGIYRNRVWHVQPTIVVKDSLEEIVLTLLPGTECIAEENYPKGKRNSGRRWFFVNEDWQLAKYTWQTNRLLLIFEPEKYYSTIFFWNQASNEFLGYYINFQLPFRRNECAVDTLDLDLDLIINPDFSYEWKDLDDYQKAIAHEIISPEWIHGIETAKQEIFAKLEKRQYPFDGSWLNWMPDPSWSPPKLPENWDKI
jgi:predicted RNA-binding protein associated with RNAse of E/G family